MASLFTQMAPGAAAHYRIMKKQLAGDKDLLKFVEAACYSVGKYGTQGERPDGWKRGKVGVGVCYELPIYVGFQAKLIQKPFVIAYASSFRSKGDNGYPAVGLNDPGTQTLGQSDLERGRGFSAGAFIFFETPTTPFGHACVSVGDGYVVSANNMVKNPGSPLVDQIMKYGNSEVAILGSLFEVNALVNPNGEYTIKATNGPFWRLRCFATAFPRR